MSRPDKPNLKGRFNGQPRERDLSRRCFLKSVGAGALGMGTLSWSRPLLGRHVEGSTSAVQGAVQGGAPDYVGRVVEAFDEKAIVEGRIQQPVVEKMLERGMLELTGAESPVDAWKSFVGPEDIVGLKINTLSGPGCSTRREVVDAILKGLELAGVEQKNIIIWDRFESHLRRTRYEIARRPGGLRCYATDSAGVGSDMDVYYEADVFSWIPPDLMKDRLKDMAPAYPKSHFSKIFTQHITKQINVPVLKDHNITGITLCLKNLAMGICSNTERFHITPVNCDPMIPEVCAHPMLKSKNVLNIADGLNLVYEGSPTVDPQYRMDYHSLLLGTDPVAMDQIALEIIEAVRREKGLPSVWKTNSQPRYVATAARIGLGTNNLDEIDHIKV